MELDLVSTSKDLLTMLHEKSSQLKSTLSHTESEKYRPEEKQVFDEVSFKEKDNQQSDENDFFSASFPKPYSHFARSKMKKMATQIPSVSNGPEKVKKHSYTIRQPPQVRVQSYRGRKMSNFESKSKFFKGKQKDPPKNSAHLLSHSDQENSRHSTQNISSSLPSQNSKRFNQNSSTQSVRFAPHIVESSPRPRFTEFLSRNSAPHLLEDDGNRRHLNEDSPESVGQWDDGSDSRPRIARRQRLHSILSRSAILRSSPPSRRTELSSVNSCSDSSLTPPRIRDAPNYNPDSSDSSSIGADYRRLGYDWIASMVENKDGTALDQPDDFYENLRTFRKQHQEECFSKSYRDEAFSLANRLTSTNLGASPHRVHISELEEVRELEEPVYSFALNERLFAVPLDETSANFLCNNDSEPKIVKVSVPLSRLRAHVSQNKPDRKRILQCDPDSASLTSHCQVGFNQPLHGRSAPSPSKVSAEPADLKSQSGLPGFYKQQPKTQAEAVAQLKRGSTGARRQIIGASGELPVPHELLLDEAEGTISALVSRHQIADSQSQNLRHKVHARQTRLRETYSAAFQLRDSS